MGGSTGPGSAFLVESELFAQEEILGRERTSRSEPRTRRQSKSAKRFSQSRRNFIMDRCLVFSLFSLQVGHNLARFKSLW